MKSKVSKKDDNMVMFIIAILLGCIAYFVMHNTFRKAKKNTILYKNDLHIIHPPRKRINIPTRGELPAYKNIGYLYNVKSSSENEVLSLYGRPTYRGSNKWNYYTMHEGVRIPIENCDKSRGCEEKYQGDNANYCTSLFTDYLYRAKRI